MLLFIYLYKSQFLQGRPILYFQNHTVGNNIGPITQMELYVNIPLPEDGDEEGDNVVDDQREVSENENSDEDSSSDEESSDDDDNEEEAEVTPPVSVASSVNPQSAAKEFENRDSDSDFVEEVEEAERTDIFDVFKVTFIYLVIYIY